MKISCLFALLAVNAVSAFSPVAFSRNVRASTSLNAEVTVALIKDLRETTGAGMMDCKKALLEVDGDFELALADLRKKGLAKADKKASRVAAEGKIVAASSGERAVLVEVNCETDFVAKDGSFLDFAQSVAGAALGVQGEDFDALMGSSVPGFATVEESRQAIVAKIGENIQVRRMSAMGGPGFTVGSYVHMGKIGVMVQLEGGTEELATDVAMHVAAMNPAYATQEDVPAEAIAKERAVLESQVEDSNKPPEIIQKMIDGRIRKYLEDICLVSQTFVKTNDKTVGKLLSEKGAKMIAFKRLNVGEGIEKKEDDFAAEVARMAAGGK
jgi:elongation factor Ts